MSESTEKIITKSMAYVIKPESGSQKSGSLSTYSKEETDAKFKDFNYILSGVVLVLLIMVATLVIDSFHINSVTYKEYSQKTESVENTQNVNKELLDQNQKNQQLILEVQKQILDLIKK